MTQRKPPRIGLGGFAEFASAMSSGRITAVQNVITNEFGGYEPGHDFYRQFRTALSEGIANGDDPLRVRRAIDECTMPSKKTHYEELAVGWVRWRAKKKLECSRSRASGRAKASKFECHRSSPGITETSSTSSGRI
ncbi:hypothetical protein Mycsm_01776 [Mycobacterium sp. JS623]|uniref:hypothetical protein n=1 Tax=Mycobacterium sp. JS623 TaxID=212767 RepID=UPI0002A570DF|nr:hypothetical protein [Mycobacterium sp. JS623]AGB22166.1 hypothetical protein Mycsm_01776 [Mycobacterium sp. JS623]